MSKKLIYLISFIFVLGPASTSYGIVIGNFEQQMDGWSACTWSPAGNPVLSYSDTNGVTLDSYSLKAVQPTGWYWFLILDVDPAALKSNNIISIDITRLASEWTRGTGDHWCGLDVRIQGDGLGLTDLGNSNSWWDSNDPDANNTMIATWDYTLYRNKMPASPSWAQIIIATNTGGYTGSGIWYLDNIQLLSGRNENPRNGAWGVQINPVLRWSAATDAKYDVYFGTDFNSVNDANRALHPGLLYYSENQDANYYPLSGTLNLAYGQIYYWRIDDVVGTPPNISKGTVWHFTTMLLGGKNIVIGDWENNMDGWASADPNDPNIVLSYGTTGATLNNYSLTVSVPDDWLQAVRIPLNTTGLVDDLLANNTFSLDVTWITSEWAGSGWAQIESIYINGDGIGTNQLGPTGDTSNPGSPGGWDTDGWGASNTRTITWDYSGIDFSTLPANPEVLELIINTNSQVGVRGLYHFDNARLLDPRRASNPKPADGATDVQMEPTLSWTPGDANKHDVYFGVNFDDVNDANTSTAGIYKGRQDANTYDVPGTLAIGTTYYWRIDEVNGVNIWRGGVWSFTTGHYLTVDDFEQYNPSLAEVWKTGGKATVSLSTDIVHEGGKAMAVDYNNTPSPYYSEAYADTNGPNSLDIDFGTNWLAEGVKALSLWLRGIPDVRGSFSYLGTDPLGPYSATITADGATIWGTYDQFHYAYKQLSDTGYIQARVDSVENTNEWAKAGVMIRQSLEPGSLHAMVVVTPGNGVAFQYREVDDGNTVHEAGVGGVTAPHWVRLTRWWDGSDYYLKAEHANDVSGSPDAWTQFGDDVLASFGQGWDIDVNIGLCLTSHSYGLMCDANFSNVTLAPLEGSISGDWQSQDIGIHQTFNDPEPMYVMLQDNDSNAAWYYPDTNNPNYADANVTQIGTWMEWRIDLNDFRVQGVDLAKVQRMYIGFGDRAAPGGLGIMYIDDIRLYRPECYRPKLTRRPADYDFDCIIDEKDLDLLTENWLQTPADPNINLYGGGTIDFRDFAEFGKYWYQQQVWPTW